MHVSFSFYPAISADKKKKKSSVCTSSCTLNLCSFLHSLCVRGTPTGALAHNGRDKTEARVDSTTQKRTKDAFSAGNVLERNLKEIHPV